MAGLYLYAVADEPLAAAARGIFGNRLRSIDFHGIHAIVERAERTPRATLARLRAQDRVLRELSRAHAALLPARFGAFSTRRELESSLVQQRTRLKRGLRKVRGCVQVTLRLSPAERRPPRPRSSGGAVYLRQLAADARARGRHPELRLLRDAVRGLIRDGRVQWHDTPVRVVSVYHLVPRSRLQAYLDAIDRLVRRRGVKLTATGPWLPFAFVGEWQ
jgi:hypothetical protein